MLRPRGNDRPPTWLSHALLGAGVWIGMLACGSESAPVPAAPPPLVPAEEAVSSGPPLAPPPEPVVPSLAAWADMPEGFEPVLLPQTHDACIGTVIWVGVDAVSAVARAPSRFDPATEQPAPSVEGEIERIVGPLYSELFAPGYNGPGGEPRFRWLADGASALLMFDRRIDRERFVGALRGADMVAVVRVGGVDPDGRPRCALVAIGEPDDMTAQPENQTSRGRVEPDGTLVVARDGLPDERLADAPEGPLPGETGEGLHMVRLDPSDDAPVATYVQAAARARWADRRYAYFEIGLP